MRCFFLFGFAVIVLAACTETYHPEYHPVTVSTVSQNISYPVNVQSGTAPPLTPGVTIVRQAPGQ